MVPPYQGFALRWVNRRPFGAHIRRHERGTETEKHELSQSQRLSGRPRSAWRGVGPDRSAACRDLLSVHNAWRHGESADHAGNKVRRGSTAELDPRAPDGGRMCLSNFAHSCATLQRPCDMPTRLLNISKQLSTFQHGRGIGHLPMRKPVCERYLHRWRGSLNSPRRGRNKSAQGNTLGIEGRISLMSPERA